MNCHLNIDFFVRFNYYEGFVDINISAFVIKGDFFRKIVLLLIFIALKFIYYR